MTSKFYLNDLYHDFIKNRKIIEVKIRPRTGTINIPKIK